jgi:uncharacterized protein (DUF362 family)
MKNLVSQDFVSYEETVAQILDEAGAGPYLAEQPRILLKPNLTTDIPFPVTTPPALCEAVIHYIRSHNPDAEVVIAEGCGQVEKETEDMFQALGYVEMAERLGVELVDLNYLPLRTVEHPSLEVYSCLYLPEIAFTYAVVSLPVLKAHTLVPMTGTIKNMMGFLPPKHYTGVYGVWKKAVFHGQLHESLRDLSLCLRPQLTLLDASVGLAGHHLGGVPCSPPVGKLLAGTDPFAVDREGARLLGIDWREVEYLREV